MNKVYVLWGLSYGGYTSRTPDTFRDVPGVLSERGLRALIENDEHNVVIVLSYDEDEQEVRVRKASG